MQSMEPGALLLSFEGRIDRKTYWICFLAFLVLGTAIGISASALGDAGSVLELACLPPMTWSGLAIQAKRWHDRDKSAWWILIALVPGIGPLWALVENGLLPGSMGDNRFGADPATRSR